MTTATTRLITEQQFHDRQAAERAESFRSGRSDLRFADADFLDHETWVRPAFSRLGELKGKSALDYGCGHGMAAVVMARRGAEVTAFDLSPGYVREAGERAQANGVRVWFVVADAEDLPFGDGSFDVVWGNAVLHHLDLDRAGAELHRVLRPGGVAVFCEPWGGNPALEYARRRLPYPGKHRTPDERPLRSRDLAPLRRYFPDLRTEGFQLVSMIRRALPTRPKLDQLVWLEHRVLERFPGLGNWCRYMVLTLRKR